MRGSIRQRYKGSWSIILHLGYHPDPVTGKPILEKKAKTGSTARSTMKHRTGEVSYW